MAILDVLTSIRREGRKAIGVLIDPDKVDEVSRLHNLLHLASENLIDFFLVGGSLVTTPNTAEIIRSIKSRVNIPVILFPGNSIQIDSSADALLFLSLISGRNPELLIGQHVIAAPIIRNAGLEVIPTGYILVNSGRLTSVAYISNTVPIPDDKYSLAACTAMAGEMLGLKAIYLDAGSGAEKEISAKMIASVRKVIDVPLIVGGGIDSAVKAHRAIEAGADMIVIGNALEKDPNLLIDIAEKVYEWNQEDKA